MFEHCVHHLWKINIPYLVYRHTGSLEKYKAIKFSVSRYEGHSTSFAPGYLLLYFYYVKYYGPYL